MSRLPAARCLALLASLLAPVSASAQEGLISGLRAILDTNLSSVSTTTTGVSGTETTTRTNTFWPQLTLTTDALIYPSLRLSAGGVFEINTFSSPENEGNADVTITRLRPFFELRGMNPIVSPGVSYYRRENRTSLAGAPSFNLVNEDYTAYVGWKPEALPLFDVQYVRTNTFDGDRVFQDTSRDFGQVISRYGYRTLNAYYQGSILDTTDRRNGVESHQTSHSGRLDHSATFFAQRLQWNGTYSASRQDLTSSASGDGGEVALPVIPFAGLSLLSDTPITARLTENPLLIDANLTASAGVNLGLPPVGADAQARNIGLDFQAPSEVNRLLIWIDRELPADIARTFSWEVYSSPDNLIWSREAVVPVAPFGPFENRFQVDFPNVTARYIKAVTRPLSGAVVDASRYPDILVTEVQAWLTNPAGEARDTLSRMTQNVNADLRMRILDTPALYYEGSYWYNGVDPSEPEVDTIYRDTLSNGLSVSHRFNRMVSAYGRGAYEQGHLTEGRRTATVTSATLTVDPVRTLTASLLYTGQDERIGDRPSDQRSFMVQTHSQLYRGVDLQLGLGWNFSTRETGEELRDRYFNVTAGLAPRRNVTLTLNYVGSTTKRSGEFAGEPEFFSRRGYLTLAYDPVETLHLVLEEEVVALSDEKTRTTTYVGVNWVPFPDGSLQVNVGYDDALRALEFGTERSFRAGVRWKFARQSYLDVTYQRLRSEFTLQTTRSRVLSMDLRLSL